MDYNVKGCKIKDIISLNEIITISKQRFSDGYFFKGESHNFYETVIVIEGSVGITSEKRIFSLSKGQMTVHPPLEFHSIKEQSNTNPECIIFSFSASAFPKIKSHIYNISNDLTDLLKSIYEESKDIFDIEPPTEEILANSEGTAAFDFGLIISGIKDGKATAACKFAKELELFLISALESPSDIEIENGGSENYAKIIDIMESHVDDNLSMEELSKLCGISIPTIEKNIYKYLRCGAISYYNNIRMNKAYYLLALGKSVKDVALTLNFANQSYFSLSFKKFFGISPSSVAGKQ